MACNCGKKKIVIQPKKIVKTQPTSNTTRQTRRIIKRISK